MRLLAALIFSFQILSAPFAEAAIQTHNSGQSPLIFDLPVTYNYQVSFWVNNFQTHGQKWFRDWLGKASRYLPFIQDELRKANLPSDLAYMVMIESGFSA